MGEKMKNVLALALAAAVPKMEGSSYSPYTSYTYDYIDADIYWSYYAAVETWKKDYDEQMVPPGDDVTDCSAHDGAEPGHPCVRDASGNAHCCGTGDHASTSSDKDEMGKMLMGGPLICVMPFHCED